MTWSNPLSVESTIRRAQAKVEAESAPKAFSGRFLAKGLIASAIVAGGVVLLATRFSVGFATQEYLCLPPYRVWIIDKFDKEPVRGEIFAFMSKGIGPIFEDGSNIVKVLEGMPGDQVSVTEEQTTINGHVVGTGLDVAAKHGIPAEKYIRSGMIQPNTYWFFGRTADSFDSRYWGSVSESQIVGRAYPLW